MDGYWIIFDYMCRELCPDVGSHPLLCLHACPNANLYISLGISMCIAVYISVCFAVYLYADAWVHLCVQLCEYLYVHLRA